MSVNSLLVEYEGIFCRLTRFRIAVNFAHCFIKALICIVAHIKIITAIFA